MTRPRLASLGMVLCFASLSLFAHAQEMKIPDNVSPEQREKIMERMRSRGGATRSRAEARPSSRPAGPPQKDGKQEAEKNQKPGDKKPNDKQEGAKEDAGANVVKRPETPKEPADPRELQARPEADGKLMLDFKGHPWTAMIEWYSRASGREIEWRELPGGFVNLRTRQRYTLEETRNILNRLLLARGYTMLDDGEFLMIEKTEGINKALVPRVRPTQLPKMQSHSFVRTSFRLGRVQAEEIAKELETMKSKNGSVTAMVSANRIEAMDTVGNLVDMMLTIEDEEHSGRYSPREFRLKYARAENVKTKLEEMLGVRTQAPPMTPQQMQQMQQMQARMAAQNKGKAPPPKKEEKISIVVNDVNNSVIVKAPPNRMLDIEETIEYLDIERNRGGLDNYLERVKTYRFATLNPEEVRNILLETAGLDPTTTIRVDKTSKSIIVDAPPWDHMVVEKLASKLDGSARQFKVIQLRRLSAVQVATTVEAMMGEPEEDNKRSRYSYFSYRYGQQEENSTKDKFTIGADTENNRLLLKCNDIEYQTVLDLLRQLGEVPRTGNNVENQVTLDIPTEDQDAFLKRVQEAFQNFAPNKVILPPAQEKPAEETNEANESDDDGTLDPALEVRIRPGEKPFAANTVTRFAQLAGDTRAAADSVNEAPPIVIERNAQGQIVMKSKDPAALEMFEELMRQMAPRKQDWVHFKLKYVTALWMKYQLEDFFEEEDDDQGFGRFFYFREFGGQDDNKAPGLGDQPKLRFIDDGESTLVVRNASPSQLATIERLIALYDVSEPPNEQNARFRKIFHIKHTRARSIEEALKEAFRDLLSNKDKVFDEQNKGKGGDSGGGSRRGGFWGAFSDEPSTGLGTSTFKGKISFGVHETTNLLIVTTEGQRLMEVIEEMINELDVAAVDSDETRVVNLPAHLNSGNLKEALTKMFGSEVVKEQGKTDPNQRNQGQPEGGEKPEGGKPPAAAVRRGR